MEAINYLGLGLRDNLQIGSDTAAGEEINLNDGLSLDELKIIDNNGDGQITLEEFQNSYGSNTEKAKEIYQKTLNWLNSTTKKNDDGTTVITQKTNDTAIESIYNQNGELKSYSSVTKDSASDKIIVEEYSIDGKARNKVNYTQYLNGTIESEFQDGKLEGKIISKNNIIVAQTNYKQVVQVQDTDINNITDNVAISYSETGTITGARVQIGDEVYEGEEISYISDSNTCVIKDSEGKVIATRTEKDGKTFIAEYKDGKKFKVYDIDSKGNPISTKQYDENGILKSSKDASSGITKEYGFDENGKLVSSTTYNAEGKKVSSEKYMEQDASEIYGNQTGYLLSEKTLYDENGNVSEYREFSYHTSDKNEIVKEVKSYSDEGKSNPLSISTYVQDSYGNTNQKTIEKSNGETSKTEYKFKSNSKGKISIPSGYSEIIETSGNKSITYKYKNGSVVQKQIDLLKDGSTEETTNYEYEYFANSNNKIKQVKKTDKNGFTVIFNANIDKSGSQTYIFENKTKASEYFDEFGNRKTIENEYITQKLNLYNMANQSSSEEDKQNINERISILNNSFKENIEKYETKAEEDYSQIKETVSDSGKSKIQLDYNYNTERIKLLKSLINTSDFNEINKINESLNQLYMQYLEDMRNLK